MIVNVVTYKLTYGNSSSTTAYSPNFYFSTASSNYCEEDNNCYVGAYPEISGNESVTAVQVNFTDSFAGTNTSKIVGYLTTSFSTAGVIKDGRGQYVESGYIYQTGSGVVEAGNKYTPSAIEFEPQVWYGKYEDSWDSKHWTIIGNISNIEYTSESITMQNTQVAFSDTAYFYNGSSKTTTMFFPKLSNDSDFGFLVGTKNDGGTIVQGTQLGIESAYVQKWNGWHIALGKTSPNLCWTLPSVKKLGKGLQKGPSSCWNDASNSAYYVQGNSSYISYYSCDPYGIGLNWWTCMSLVGGDVFATAGSTASGITGTVSLYYSGTQIPNGQRAWPVLTKTTVSCNPKSVVAGSSTTITCKAKVAGYFPIGTVSWSQSGTGSVSLNSTSCFLTRQKNSDGACSVAMVGSSGGYVILTANYTGDPNNQGSFRIVRLNVIKAPTFTTISCTPSLFVIGASITCVVSVTGEYPLQTGIVVFTVSGRSHLSPSNTCTLASGSCSVVVTTVVSKATVRGTYRGDTNNRGSSGIAKVTECEESEPC